MENGRIIFFHDILRVTLIESPSPRRSLQPQVVETTELSRGTSTPLRAKKASLVGASMDATLTWLNEAGALTVKVNDSPGSMRPSSEKGPVTPSFTSGIPQSRPATRPPSPSPAQNPSYGTPAPPP